MTGIFQAIGRTLRHLWLGLLLIALASAVLLYSDWDRRQVRAPAPAAKKLPRIAVMQWASTDLLDHTVAGVTEGLRAQGFEHGRTADIRYLNASGDNTTGNVMARELAGGSFDIVITASTLALQAVAQANAAGRAVHIFGGVTDPYGAGVGITGPAPDQHPKHLVGVGTFQPVDRAFRLAHQMNPALRRVGVVWNPGESNSEACVKVARKTCAALGVELIEANAGNTSEVPEAIRSVLSRGAQAIWVGGDTVAISSISAIVTAARAARMPVFTNDPSDAAHGALFGVGASYQKVGLAVGMIAGKILKGASTRDFGVENLVPEVLGLNESVLADTGEGWSVPAEVRAQANAVGEAKPEAPARAAGPEPGRVYHVGVLSIAPHPAFEQALEGVRETLRDAGFVEGRNLTLRFTHANGDMSLLPQIADQMNMSGPDLIIPMSTPCLAATLSRVKDRPLVFAAVSAPLEAGAGRSFSDHLPHVTGAVWTAPNPQLFDWLARLYPDCRKVGVLYNPSEANSRMEIALARDLLKAHGIGLVERAVNSTSEIPEAFASMLTENIGAVFGMSDNTVNSGMASVAQACRRAHLPLVADDLSQMGTGALYTFGASPRGEGRQAGRLAARVLLGESPAGIPFAPSVECESAVDFAAAAELGMTFPADMLKRVDIFQNPARRIGRPCRVVMVNLVRSPLLDAAERGVLRGLENAGFREGTDVMVKKLNAQGDIAQLPAMMDAARMENPDLIMTVTTPAFLTAARSNIKIPVVFTVASDPAALGVFEPDRRPPNITGVHDDPPVDRLLEMARRHVPGLAAVGIIYDAAQPNSLISVKKLRAACVKTGIQLHEVTASSQSDLPAATQAVIQRGAGAIIISADNLTLTGFPAIHRAASAERVPTFVTSPELMSQGATGAIGDDYGAWGEQSGRMAARVLAGVPPADLPVEATRVQDVREPGESP